MEQRRSRGVAAQVAGSIVIVLIVLAVIAGIPAYAFMGFLVYIAAAKVTGNNGWQYDWKDDEGVAMSFLLLWPVYVLMGVISLPFYGVYLLTKKLADKWR